MSMPPGIFQCLTKSKPPIYTNLPDNRIPYPVIKMSDTCSIFGKRSLSTVLRLLELSFCVFNNYK